MNTSLVGQEAVVFLLNEGNTVIFGTVKRETTAGVVVTHKDNKEIGEWFPFKSLHCEVKCHQTT